MGLTSIGSNPVFPIINKVFWLSYLINHTRFALITKQILFFVYNNKNILKHLAVFFKLGIISKFFHLNNKIVNSVSFYKNIQVCKKIKLISKYNHPFYIQYNQLRIINKYLGNSVYILSTPIGILRHQQALQKKIGGKILYFFY